MHQWRKLTHRNGTNGLAHLSRVADGVGGTMGARWALLGGVLLVLYLAREVMAPFIVAGALAYIFSPVIDELHERTRLPRAAIVGLFYVLVLGALGLGIWVVETRIVRELDLISIRGPGLIDAAVTRLIGTDAFTFLGAQVDAHAIADWLNSQASTLMQAPSGTIQVVERALDWIGKTFLTLLALFYFLLDGRHIGGYLVKFVPLSRRPAIQEVGGHVHWVLGRYLRGQLFLICLMTAVTYVVLTFVFHLPFAVLLAILTGVLEVIPFLGPVLAGAAAALVALSVNRGSPELMIGVIIAYTVLRQVEDQLVMPIVVGRAVRLHPLITIFAVLTGAATAGVLGAVLAVPIAAATRVTLDYVFAEPKVKTAAVAPEAASSVSLPMLPPTVD